MFGWQETVVLSKIQVLSDEVIGILHDVIHHFSILLDRSDHWIDKSAVWLQA